MILRILVLAVFFSPQQTQAQQSAEQFIQLQKIAGTWGMETSKGMLYEHWTVLSPTQISVISYRLNGSDTIVLERVNVISNQDNILYIPVVSGQNNNQPVVLN